MSTPFAAKAGQRRTAGFTLLEILIAGSLALVVLTLVFQTLLPTMAASAKAARRVELHQRATLLGDQVVADLRGSSRAGIGVSRTTERRSVSIHPRQPAVLAVTWQPELRIYDWQDKRLVKWIATLPAPPAGPLVPTLAALESLPKQARWKIADVALFDVVVDSGASVRVQLTLQRDGEREKLDFSRAVFLRSSD